MRPQSSGVRFGRRPVSCHVLSSQVCSIVWKVSLFDGQSSASFSDIRACLRGWVMDPLRWYVLWLQRVEYGPGGFHQTITQQLLCYTMTSRRSPAAPQITRFPNSPTYPPTKPTIPPGPPGISVESNTEAQIQTPRFHWRIWNMYFSLLSVAPILFWNNTSENRYFSFPLGRFEAGWKG